MDDTVFLEIEMDVNDDDFLKDIDFNLLNDNEPLENPQNENSINTGRFKAVSSEDIENFLTENENKNTKSKTDQDLKVLRNFLALKGEHRTIESIPPTELSDHISKFLLSVKKKNGEEYEPSSLRGFIASFDRHLKKSGCPYTIITDEHFSRCREVLKAKSKQLKSIGKGNKPNAAEPISEAEIDILFERKQLGSDNPRSLQQSLWFVAVSQFGMRTGTEVHALCWGDISIGIDPDTTQYLLFDQERQTKTRTGINPRDTRAIKPRAYETLDNPERCPVRLYKLFASKRPQQMSAPDSPFFLTPKPKWEDGKPGYKNMAMGINKIYSIMNDMKALGNIGENKRLTPYR